METSVSLNEQYKNIVRKFFFRQNPPKPLTKEEFIVKNQLERKSIEEIENRYYSYLYVYNYQYVKELDQKVACEMKEAKLKDKDLTEIENFLLKGNDFNPKEKTSKRKKKHSKPKKKKSFSIKNKWMELKEKITEGMKDSKSSHLALLLVCGTITLASVVFGIYQFGGALADLVFSGIDAAFKDIAISVVSLMIGAISWTAQSIVRNKDDEDFEEDEKEWKEESMEFFQPKKQLEKSKEKEEITTANELDFEDENESDKSNTIPMQNTTNYKIDRTSPSAVPFFEKKPKKAKNSFMVNAKSFLNNVVDSLKLDDPFEDEDYDFEMDENSVDKEKAKVKVR